MAAVQATSAAKPARTRARPMTRAISGPANSMNDAHRLVSRRPRRVPSQYFSRSLNFCSLPVDRARQLGDEFHRCGTLEMSHVVAAELNQFLLRCHSTLRRRTTSAFGVSRPIFREARR